MSDKEKVETLRAALNRLLTECLAIHGDDLCDQRTIEQAVDALEKAGEG